MTNRTIGRTIRLVFTAIATAGICPVAMAAYDLAACTTFTVGRTANISQHSTQHWVEFAANADRWELINAKSGAVALRGTARVYSRTYYSSSPGPYFLRLWGNSAREAYGTLRNYTEPRPPGEGHYWSDCVG